MTVGCSIEMTVSKVEKDSKGRWNYTAEATEQGHIFELRLARVEFIAELGFAQPGQTLAVHVSNTSIGNGPLLQGQ